MDKHEYTRTLRLESYNYNEKRILADDKRPYRINQTRMKNVMLENDVKHECGRTKV